VCQTALSAYAFQCLVWLAALSCVQFTVIHTTEQAPVCKLSVAQLFVTQINKHNKHQILYVVHCAYFCTVKTGQQLHALFAIIYFCINITPTHFVDQNANTHGASKVTSFVRHLESYDIGMFLKCNVMWL
jgi:hypothetical protein